MNLIEQALDGFRQALEADGYELVISVEAGLLRLAVQATPDACEECLIPKHLMLQMIENTLTPDLDVRRIELRYPKDQ